MGIRLKTEEKAALFDKIFMTTYDELIELDVLANTCSTLFARDRTWRNTVGAQYDYDTMIQRYIMDVCADAEPDEILRELRLEQIEDNLRKESLHRVYYTIREEQGIRLKEAGFMRKDAGHVMMYIQDITDAVRDVSKRAGRLENALKNAQHEIDEKNTFLTLMSRIIRTPLYSIMGLTRMAQEDLGDNRALDAYLRKISMSGSYMTDAIDDILELRDIAKNSIPVKEDRVFMEDLLKDVRRGIQDGLYERGLTFRLDCADGQKLHVLTDYNALRQILLKMLKASTHYTVRGGRITLHIRQLFRSPGDVTLEFSVESRGIVIDQERLRYLFQPYVVLKDKIDSGLDALDIDLIILRSYVIALGSRTLTAVSDKENGTKITATFTFRLAEESQMPGAVAISETGESADSIDFLENRSYDFEGLRVLLVDDNEINLEIGEKILRTKGIKVTTARDGREALEVVQREEPFDLILMDILMPVMDGLEATRRIRRSGLPGTADIPIIAMTVNAFRENFEESSRAGMNAHLVKPIDPEQLYDIMEGQLMGRGQ